jgi:hypothetical protein
MTKQNGQCKMPRSTESLRIVSVLFLPPFWYFLVSDIFWYFFYTFQWVIKEFLKTFLVLMAFQVPLKMNFSIQGVTRTLIIVYNGSLSLFIVALLPSRKPYYTHLLCFHPLAILYIFLWDQYSVSLRTLMVLVQMSLNLYLLLSVFLMLLMLACEGQY